MTESSGGCERLKRAADDRWERIRRTNDPRENLKMRGKRDGGIKNER